MRSHLNQRKQKHSSFPLGTAFNNGETALLSGQSAEQHPLLGPVFSISQILTYLKITIHPKETPEIDQL